MHHRFAASFFQRLGGPQGGRVIAVPLSSFRQQTTAAATPGFAGLTRSARRSAMGFPRQSGPLSGRARCLLLPS